MRKTGKGKVRNFRFRREADEFLTKESARQGRNMTIVVEAALHSLSVLKSHLRDDAVSNFLRTRSEAATPKFSEK